jgi:hypothetical protein
MILKTDAGCTNASGDVARMFETPGSDCIKN